MGNTTHPKAETELAKATYLSLPSPLHRLMKINPSGIKNEKGLPILLTLNQIKL
jgi:hypothetical protein